MTHANGAELFAGSAADVHQFIRDLYNLRVEACASYSSVGRAGDGPSLAVGT